MNKVFDFINRKITPIATKISRNDWIASLQEAIVATLPLTLVGSLVSVVSILNDYFTWFPNFYPINQFSFGLIGLMIAFILPAYVLRRKRIESKMFISGFASVGAYIMLLRPVFTEAGEIALVFENLGASGMFLGMVSGFFTALFFVWFDKVSLFGKNKAIPDYIVASFDSFVPVLVALVISWFIIYQLDLDFFSLLTSMLMPLTNFGQSYFGLLAYVLGTTIMYSFGISPWLLYGLFYPIQLSGIQQNAELIASGLAATNIHTGEVVQAFITLGGMGTTLPLAFMLLRSRSAKLSTIGKASIIPSILNINEPLVFGAPIMLNPLLMIPFILNSLIITTLVYFTFYFGLATIPSQIFMLWFIPAPLQAYLATYDWRGVILVIVTLIVSVLIWYPFFKVYEKQQVDLEKQPNE